MPNWDLAFQCVTMALVDPAFAKENLWLLLFEQFQHPNGQIPGYEWEFSDVQPAGARAGPAGASTRWRSSGPATPTVRFLERCFHKLLINFAWWVNKVDRHGLNVFEGGFLGLDNITVINRSEPLADGATLEQSDASGWMAFFTLSMMRIALELARDNPVYETMATKFFEHFVYISGAMKKMGGRDYQLWDEEDGFFYDVLRYPDGRFHKFEVRSLVGLIPLFAIEVVDEEADAVCSRTTSTGSSGTAATWWGRAVSPRRAERPLAPRPVDRRSSSARARAASGCGIRPSSCRMAGLRSLSKYHKDHPFVFGGAEVRYEPAESDVKIKGGNSNWRGPVWFPTTFLLIESLRKYDRANECRSWRVRTAASPDVDLTPREWRASWRTG